LLNLIFVFLLDVCTLQLQKKMTARENSESEHQSTSNAKASASGEKPTTAVNTPPPETELLIEAFRGTPDEIERQWYEKIYLKRDPSMLQLTWRAVIMGSVLGGILSLTNIYVGLKAGWALGVSITACILSFAIWTSFHRLGIVKSSMSILENNCMQSTATSAGVSSGATLISAFAAYMMINGTSLSYGLTLAWVFLIALLGVTMAIPMKRQMVNVEQLRFPSGTATAETLHALYSHGEKGMRAAKALAVSGVFAGLVQFWSDGFALFDKWKVFAFEINAFSLSELMHKFNSWLLGKDWITRTVAFQFDPIFIAAGTLSGMRAGVSMMIGGTLCWAVFVPILQDQGIITGTRYKDIVGWTLWGGVACMVTSGLLSFGMQWRSIGRAVSNVTKLFTKEKSKNPVDDLETPMSWFFIGQFVALVGLAFLAHLSFNMPVWQSAIAVFVSFFLALVACRVTGETDTTPVGSMGKVTQLMFGVLNPGNMNVNLMAANITAGAANASADLLTDLKSGYLLGANPRKQFIAQFSGIFIGTLVSVTCFSLMIPDASHLGTEQFPAPAAQTWRAVAEALSKGLSALGPIKVWSIIIGGSIGIILPILSRLFPKQEKYIPSAAGLGLAWTFQWYYSFLFFVGAVLGWVFEKASPNKAKEFTFPIASGLIAGGSLMGVVITFCDNGDGMLKVLKHLFGH